MNRYKQSQSLTVTVTADTADMHSFTKLSPPTSPLPTTVTFNTTPPASPTSPDAPGLPGRFSAAAKRYKYLRRIFKFRQMDFEYAFWQMLYLFVSPQKVYRNFSYRKQTKDQWARDDPAFLVLLSFWLCVSSIGFAVALSLSFVGFIKFLLWVVFVDCIGVGILIATVMWFVANKYLVGKESEDQDVEWGFAFDVHLNAFFPLLMILHLFQLFFLNVLINHEWFISRLFGNTLWLIAIGYYIYITFLGYSSLPFLKKTRTLLYPMTALAIMYILSLIVGWNFSQGLCHFYKARVI